MPAGVGLGDAAAMTLIQPWTFSVGLLAMACPARCLPPVVRPTRAALGSIDPALLGLREDVAKEHSTALMSIARQIAAAALMACVILLIWPP